MEEEKIRVWAYSGYKANERPLRFNPGGMELTVKDILDRWRDEGNDFFRVVADDGRTWLLRWDREADEWYGKRGVLHQA